MPEIYSTKNDWSPIKERYQLANDISTARLPCDDRKIADTVACQ
jgi:hypothetical protein